MFGPFVHKLNKGGLDDIVANGRLLSTTAAGTAGGGDGVRAHQGSFQDLYRFHGWAVRPDPNEIFIEFKTAHQPLVVGPPHRHSMVRWLLDAGQYLLITITGVYNGCGQRLS
ncbi:MAG TPA: hypothetical protein VMB47_08805 [Candidatus Aquilonibacter sp.]|nr:hypothetical protein [Candidatus Aquilonibacter sp.]